MASPAGSGVQSETYEVTEATVVAESRPETYADLQTVTETLANYIGRDLRQLVNDAHISLATELDVPPRISTENRVILELLCHDIERLLRLNLISEIYMGLADKKLNARGRYPLRYEARYEITRSTWSGPSNSLASNTAWNSLVRAPTRTLNDAQFVFAVAWRPGVKAKQVENARPPEYFFQWLRQRRLFDGEGLVRYRFGGAAAGPIRIDRSEHAQPNLLNR